LPDVALTLQPPGAVSRSVTVKRTRLSSPGAAAIGAISPMSGASSLAIGSSDRSCNRFWYDTWIGHCTSVPMSSLRLASSSHFTSAFSSTSLQVDGSLPPVFSASS
jgi:hypothetical protein